jgi:hypothetical protein
MSRNVQTRGIKVERWINNLKAAVIPTFERYFIMKKCRGSVVQDIRIA